MATLCEAGEVYLAQHMGDQGRWVSSTDKKSCMTDKLEILDYCKKVSRTATLSRVAISCFLMTVPVFAYRFTLKRTPSGLRAQKLFKFSQARAIVADSASINLSDRFPAIERAFHSIVSVLLCNDE